MLQRAHADYLSFPAAAPLTVNEKLAVKLIEAVKHGMNYVIRVDETAARAWPEPRVRTIPCLAVLMDEMTASAKKRARWQGIHHHCKVQMARGG
jgi:hypothetical protein